MPSIIALSQTSRHFHRLADPYDKTQQSLMTKFQIKAQESPRWQAGQPEGWERYREGWRRCGYACYTCKKVLASDRFDDKDVKGTRKRLGRRYNRRWCIQCGLETGRLLPGSVMKQGNTRRIVCRQYGELKGGRTCVECKVCSDCDLYGFEIQACETKGYSC